MIQVSESRVTEALDELAAKDMEMASIDMARGAVHLAVMLDLITPSEFRRRCDALLDAKYGPEGAAHKKEQK